MTGTKSTSTVKTAGEDGNGAQTIKSLSDLRDAVLRGNLIVFVGAGLSQGAGYPGWWFLVNELARDLGIDPSEFREGDLLKIPQIYYEQRSRNEYLQRIRGIFGPQRTPTDSHRLLMDLGAAHIITTNYENLLEEAAITQQRLYEVVADDKSAAYTKSPSLIVKMHGDLSKGNVILKEEDYLSYSRLFPLVEALVKGLIATHTVLFLGFSFSDWNIKNILRWVQELSGSDTRPCYLFRSAADAGRFERDYLKQRGIHLITYGDITNALPSLESVKSKVSELRRLPSNAIEVTNQTDQTSIFISCLLPYVQIHSDYLRLMTDALAPLSGRMCVFHQEIEAALKPLDRHFYVDKQLSFFLPAEYFNSLRLEEEVRTTDSSIDTRNREQFLSIVSNSSIEGIASRDSPNRRFPTPMPEVTDRLYSSVCKADFAAMHEMRDEFLASTDSKEEDRAQMSRSFIAYMLNDYSSIILTLDAVISRGNPMQRLDSWMRAKLNWLLMFRHLREIDPSIQQAVDRGDLHEGENPQSIFERLDHVQKRSVGYVPLLCDFELIYKEHQTLDVLLQAMSKKKENIGVGGFTTGAPEAATLRRAEGIFKTIILLRLQLLHYSEVKSLFRKAVEVVLLSLSTRVDPRSHFRDLSSHYEILPLSSLVWIVYFYDAKEVRKLIHGRTLREDQFDDAAKQHLLDMFANLCTSASNRRPTSRRAFFSSALFSPAKMLETSLQLLAAVKLNDEEFEKVVHGCRRAISGQASISFFESWYFFLGDQLARREGDFPTSQLTGMLEDLLMKISRNEVYFELQQAIKQETFVTSLVNVLAGKSGTEWLRPDIEEKLLEQLTQEIAQFQRITIGNQGEQGVPQFFTVLWKWHYIIIPLFAILRDEAKQTLQAHFQSIIAIGQAHYDKMVWLEFVHLLLVKGILDAQEIQRNLLSGLLAIREESLSHDGVQYPDPAQRAEEMIGNLLRHDKFTDPSLIATIRSLTELRSPYLAMALDVESALERDDFEVKLLIYLRPEEHQALRQNPRVVCRIVQEYHRLAPGDNDRLKEMIYEKYILPQFAESTSPIAQD